MENFPIENRDLTESPNFSSFREALTETNITSSNSKSYTDLDNLTIIQCVTQKESPQTNMDNPEFAIPDQSIERILTTLSSDNNFPKYIATFQDNPLTIAPTNSYNEDQIINISQDDNNQQLQKEQLINLLKDWELEKVSNHLIELRAYVNVLKIVKRHHIEHLLKPFDIVTQIMFEHHLEEWRDSIGIPFSNYNNMPSHLSSQFRDIFSPTARSAASSVSISPRTSPYSSRLPTPEMHEIKTTKLSDVLNANSKGLLLSTYYDKNKTFTKEQRTFLINTIAQYFDNNNLHLSLSTSYQLEQEIILRFPNEKLEFYRMGKRGKIYNKFCNLKSTFKTISKPEKPPINVTETASAVKNIVPEVDAESCIRSIKYDNLTCEQFDHCWKACVRYRLNEIKHASSTFEILQKWPQYKLPSGYRLIDVDFSVLYENNYSLMDNWSDVCELILTFVTKEFNIKDKKIKAVLDSLQKEEYTQNSKDATLLWALHGYLVPTQKIVRKENSGKKSTTKFTITDSQESFLLVFSSIQEVENHLDYLKRSGQNIQPLLLIIGESIRSIKEIYVYFDGIKFSCNSFIRAVDICFKTFHLFNLEYPVACSTFWTFIEIYFYKINAQNSRKVPKVHILMQELKNIQNAVHSTDS